MLSRTVQIHREWSMHLDHMARSRRRSVSGSQSSQCARIIAMDSRPPR
jgi:hypothetical protein